MKTIDFREDTSRGTYYVKQTTFFATVIVALFFQAPWLLGALSPGGQVELRQEITATCRSGSTEWQFELGSGAGAGASVVVTPQECFSHELLNGTISATMNASGSYFTLNLSSNAAPSSSANAILAEVQVHDVAGKLAETWAVHLDGGEVIVVLVDD